MSKREEECVYVCVYIYMCTCACIMALCTLVSVRRCVSV